MAVFLILGLLLTLVGGYSLVQYFNESDPFGFAGNCNPYATASSCDDIGIAYLVIGLTCGGIGLLFMLIGAIASGGRKRERAFRQSAIGGTARLISVDQPMNAELNNRPLLTFELEVTPDGLPAFQHTLRSAVSTLVMSQVRLTPGSELPVLVNPDKPTDMRIDWARAVNHQAGDSLAAQSG